MSPPSTRACSGPSATRTATTCRSSATGASASAGASSPTAPRSRTPGAAGATAAAVSGGLGARSRRAQEGPGPGRQGGHSWGQPLAVRPPVCPSHPRSCLIRSVPVKAPPGHAARPPDPRPSSLTSRPHCTAPACHPASIPAWPGAGPAARWARTSPPRPLPAVPQAGLR